MLENNIRQLCQKVGIVGTRGPMPSFVFYATLVSVIMLTLILIMLVKIYEMISTGKCLLCGHKHEKK
jgi:hypothetical protein